MAAIAARDRSHESALYVDEGRIVTSAEAAAGLDMLLHLVRQDFGHEAANAVARGLVIPGHREGDQSECIERPVCDTGDDRLSRTMAHVRTNLARDYSVADLAAVATMSPRSFYRRFLAAVGLTPHDWLRRERVFAARDLLQRGHQPMEHVAELTGFGSADNLRRHFRRVAGVAPTGYRRAFIMDAGGW